GGFPPGRLHAAGGRVEWRERIESLRDTDARASIPGGAARALQEGSLMIYKKRWLLAGVPLLALCGSLAIAAAAKKPEPPKDPKDAKTSPAATAASEAGVLATVGGEKITEQDLMSSLPPDRQKALQGAAQKIQDIEHQAVEEAFAKRWAEEQAKAKGISVDEFYAQEIAANRDSFATEFKTQIAQIKQQIYDAKRAVL